MASKRKYSQIPIPYWYQKGDILIVDTRMVSKQDDTSPTLVKSWNSIVWETQKQYVFSYPLHLEQITFRDKDSFLDVPL